MAHQGGVPREALLGLAVAQAGQAEVDGQQAVDHHHQGDVEQGRTLRQHALHLQLVQLDDVRVGEHHEHAEQQTERNAIASVGQQGGHEEALHHSEEGEQEEDVVHNRKGKN